MIPRAVAVTLLLVVLPVLFVAVVPWLIGHATPERHALPVGPLPEEAIRLLAIPVWLLGAATMLHAAWAFVARGRGTPTSAAPPTRLVIEGLYRYVRNPMYVGALLVVGGTVLWTLSLYALLYCVSLFVVFHLFIVGYEERRLRRRFGGPYDAYRQRVPRWVPRLPARGHRSRTD